jgi:predicted O-methyltransferase YrrM
MLIGKGCEIRTFTSPHELILLYDEATLAYETGVFAEIGSHLGASAVILAEALNRRAKSTNNTGTVYCIDTWKNDAMSEGSQDTWAEFSRNSEPWSSFVAPLRGHSVEVVLPSDRQLDLLFVDGDHTYQAVREDVDRHGQRVRVGGRIVFHDQDRPDVARVVGELLTTGHWRVTVAVERIISLIRLG